MPVQSKMAVEPKLSEPIAIVGTSCRFAGIATTPSKLWELLCQAPDLSRKAPADRFNIDAFYHKDGEYHGTTNSTKAYWLEQDVKCFDTGLFNITPNEAEAMDPQQRLLLEVVYEAMESAGFPLSAYSGKEVGVYSGCMTQDYETLSARDELTTSQYFATGNSRAIMANRVSYFFNFNGPSMTIDTACSSSLVALNLAMLALRAGECKMACVTGANLMLTPEQFIVESSLHMLSPVGKCHMWDVKADGYARGEGVAALIIKTLSQALADGDKIEGIIREVGVNADGKTSGITMPNSSAQAALIRSTYQRAGLDPSNPVDRCQYFEAHGTGTAAGDPREAAAIHEAFFDNGDGNREAQKSSTGLDKKEMLVGSIKTVIGHTEAAAGLAGVLKVMASMKHGFVPPNLHFNTLNPSVKPFYKHLQIPTVTTRWPEPALGQPRRASVNSFGFGGANAHAIIEAYDPEIHGATTASGVLAPPQLNGEMSGEVNGNTNGKTIAHRDSAFSLPVVISAASIKSLRDVAQTYKAYIEQNGALDIRQLSWHQYARRTGLPYRVTFSAATTAKALQELNILLRDTAIPNDRLIRGKTTKSSLRILGVFTGQGAQWAAMSKALLQQNKVYRETIMRLDAVLQTCPNPCTWKLAEQIMAGKETSRIQEAAVSQPLCTAVQIGLVDVMRSIGIDFHTVVGHSSGEIAAAYAAGKISAADAIVISYYRGTVAHLAGGANGQKGGMLAAGLSESEALSFCDEPIFEGRICVAASNAPNSVTLSGDLDAIHMANNELEMRQKFSRVLFVDTAYHSPHMTAPSVAYIQAMREYGIKPIAEAKGATWISSVGGRPRTDAQDLDCQYWSDNMVNQVQFHDAVRYLLSQPGNDFDCAIEIGPHPALQGPTIQTAKDLGRTLAYTCPLNRSKDASLSVAEFLGFMWSNFECDSVDLRSYIEQSGQQQHVLESRLDNVPPYPFDHAATHWRESRLLGSRSRDDNAHELMWRNLLKLDKIPWLEHHSFQGQALLPASAYCVMALDAARFFLAGRPASGIALDRDSPGETSTTIDASFALYSCSADGSTKMKKHASGLLTMLSLSETLPADSGAFYEMMTSIGLSYTGPFKALTSIEQSTTMDTSPATLDACFQCAFLSYSAPGDGSLWAPFLPTRIGRIQFNLAVFEGHVGAMPNTALATPNASISVDLTIFNEQGVAEIQVEDLTDDLELYLHTVMDVDPTDEIVPFNDSASDYDGALLAEHCCRDATINPWLNENEASIDTMIRQSKYAHYLQSLRQARHVAAFQAHIGRMVKQIAHRFAWMDILCLESTNVRLSRPILAAVGKLHSLSSSEDNMGTNGLLDLVIILTNISQSMKPGGFLIMVNQYNTMLHVSPTSTERVETAERPPTPPQWPDVSEACGFVQQARKCDQYHGAGCVFIRQLRPSVPARLSLATDIKPVTRQLLLIRGSCTHTGDTLYCERLDFKSCTAAVVLADVDEPIMSNMTEHLIDQLRSLMRPTLTVLPDHAASFGFLRTIAAELESQAETGKKDGRLISRVLPWKNANDRVNAERRLVTRPVNTLRQCTEAVFFRSANGTLRFEVDRIAHDVYAAPPPGETTIQVEYSSALPFKAGEALSGYVCIGRKWKTGTRLLALSATNSSYITCPLTQTVSLDGDLRPSLMILHQFIRHLANITAVLASTPEGGITLVDPDVEFTKCLSAVLASDEELHREVVILQTNSGKAGESLSASSSYSSPPLLFLHPRTTMRDLKKIFTRGTCVFNFAADDTDMSQRIAAAVAENGTYHSAFDMFNAGVAIRSEAEAFASVKAVWQIATAFINKDKDAYPYSEPVGLLSLNELRHQAGFLHPFQIIDWKSDRDTQQTVHHLVATQILSPDKTYLMFGMTRDSGHSICRFLLEQGAKTVVLASRNPVMDPNWVATLSETYRADIRIAKADVTKIDSLFALKSELLKGMPPVGGIINGAMVLDDRVFDQMTLETWNRVLHPKSIGSSNLDLVFDDHDLEFFIMTSSFAAIGGHSGQSNYAAANMYMNGIAANRRARGLAATALNIGVIYGLGFLQREKTDLYAGLERDGYLPISEHSLHHMFLEAIAAGRPSDDDDEAPHPYSITTGLRRFQRGLPDPLFWQMDPRFGHFAMRDSAEEDGPTTTAQKSLMEEIAGLDEDKEAIADAIGAGLDRRLQVLLQLPAGAIDHNNNLQGMGVDSLAAVEVRNWFHKHLAKDVAVMKILDTPSIRILCLELAEQVLVDRAEQEEESK
ncbi:beta-ketoacyl synthase domain-containing protein [Xylaria sp. CBS 124048]|nr:beta-ketoacyl synthase domain-containing protein [Xylaria sp. CBS 124048]